MSKVNEAADLVKEADDDFNWGDEEQSTPKTHVTATEIAEMPEDAVICILFQWEECRTDPIQYKPYAPMFRPKGVYIQIPVPIKYVAEYSIADESPDLALEAVLTLEGMAYVQGEIANAIGIYHEKN